MRRLQRKPLSKKSTDALKRLTAQVHRARSAKARQSAVARSWKNKPRAAFDEVKEKLSAMATGRSRCMYCEDSAGTDIEHFYPKSKYPERAFRWDNYLWACSHCNSNRKRTQFPLLRGRRPALIDPTAVDPAAHLKLVPSTGEFVAIGPRGQKSIEVFGLNDHRAPRDLPRGRREAFLKLQILLQAYDRELRAGRKAKASLRKDIIRNEPFSAVLTWLVAIAHGPRSGHEVLDLGVAELVRKHGVAAW